MGEGIPTAQQFERMTPYNKGFAVYMYAARPGCPFADRNPFPQGSKEWAEFNHGNEAAMQIAAEFDDD